MKGEFLQKYLKPKDPKEAAGIWLLCVGAGSISQCQWVAGLCENHPSHLQFNIAPQCRSHMSITADALLQAYAVLTHCFVFSKLNNLRAYLPS